MSKRDLKGRFRAALDHLSHKPDPTQEANRDRIAYLVEAIREAGRRAEKITDALGGSWEPKLCSDVGCHVGLRLHSIEYGNIHITITVEREIK